MKFFKKNFSEVLIPKKLKLSNRFINLLYQNFSGLDEGTQMLELDCQLTKDGQVVVLHDSNLLRLTGVDKNVSDLDYSDLPLLKTDLPIEFDPGELLLICQTNLSGS